MIDLTNHHLHIVGGSRGIGRATAVLAARAGADVSITYAGNAAAAEETVRLVEAEGRRGRALQGDAAADGVAEELLTQAVEDLGPLSDLVVSASVFEPAPIETMTPAFWDRVMAINVRASYLAVRAAVPHLRQRQGGSIVCYTSTAGQRGSEIYSAYATSKGAQIMFMRSMARELAPDRIRCNSVAPGWTDTDMSQQPIDEEGREDIIASVPLGRIGRPEDPAGAAVFLLSDLAQFITGSTITVDGGFDMRG